MLTPTGATVTEYWNAIKAGNPTHVKMVFASQGVTITDSDIDITYGVQITDILNGEIDLTFGQAVMKTINTRVIMSDNVRYLNWADKFSLSFGVEINGTTNWVKVGEFYGERPVNSSTVDVIEFTAYDMMKDFDILADDYLDTITWPATTQEIYEGLCTYVGIQYAAGSPLANAYARSFNEGELDLYGYTCRDILAWIAEACGCYARITADGKCKLTWFSDNTSYKVTPTEEFHIEHADLYSGMIWNEFDLLTWNEAEMFTWNEICGYYALNYGVKAVRLCQTSLDIELNYPQAEEKNIYTISDNPFLFIENTSTDTTTYVKPIYDRLDAFGGQLPMTTECVGNWLVESGDIISIYVTDEIISSSIYVRTLVWKGDVVDTYETTGNKDRAIMSPASKDRLMTSRNVKMFVKDSFYQVQSGIEIDTSGITVSGSRSVLIESGGTFDVDSTNFKISSTYNFMQTGYWKFDEYGAHCTETGLPAEFQIGNLANRTANASGLFYSISSSGGKASRLVLYTGGYNSSADAYYNCGLNIFGAYNNGDPKMTIYRRSGCKAHLGQLGGAFETVWSNELYGKQWANYSYPETFHFHPVFDFTNVNMGQPDARVDIERNYTDNTYTRQYIKIRGADDFSHDMIFEGMLNGHVVCNYSTVTNFDSLTTPGHYWVNMSSMTNGPSDLTSGSVEVDVTAITSTYIIQKIYTTNYIYCRNIYNGTSSYWYKFTGQAV